VKLFIVEAIPSGVLLRDEPAEPISAHQLAGLGQIRDAQRQARNDIFEELVG
jgi:hypothetical protein